MAATERPIDLNTPLSIRSSFLFPIQSQQGRQELLIGGLLLLLLPPIGWLMNMGHRVLFVHNMLAGRDPWPAWSGHYLASLKHGIITFLGMVYYYVPAGLCLILAEWLQLVWLLLVSWLLFAAATFAIPGYMSHYCVRFNAREIFNPALALRRSFEIGQDYWLAWLIAVSALAFSFLGLLGFGVGFFFTSVWFWQVAGFSFASAFSKKFELRVNG